ncbi:MAG: hypothetical protein R6U26_01580 [Candidatus Undinarchaeales archaeon]
MKIEKRIKKNLKKSRERAEKRLGDAEIRLDVLISSDELEKIDEVKEILESRALDEYYSTSETVHYTDNERAVTYFLKKRNFEKEPPEEDFPLLSKKEEEDK